VENYLLQIKDPIQRAGVRLLWAAAIPIQTVARRFLARQHAIKRMCAVLTIQSVSKKFCRLLKLLKRSLSYPVLMLYVVLIVYTTMERRA
jgi:hypothetical protein